MIHLSVYENGGLPYHKLLITSMKFDIYAKCESRWDVAKKTNIKNDGQMQSAHMYTHIYIYV